MARDWWTGNQGATTGYGTFEARQPPPDAPPMLDALIEDDAPVEDAPLEKKPDKNMEIFQRNMQGLQSRLVQEQLQLSQVYPQSMDNSSYRNAMQQVNNTKAAIEQLKMRMSWG